MQSQSNQLVATWIAQLGDQSSKPAAVAKLATELAQALHSTPRLAQLLTSIGGQSDDLLDCSACQELLPLYLSPVSLAQTERLALQAHLSGCPHCIAALAQLQTWIHASELDTTPIADVYPHFTIPPVPTEGAASSWITQAQAALNEGRQWFEDAVGNVVLLFAPAPELQGAWAVKSAAPGALLAQTTLADDEAPGWELEMSAFAVDDARCRLEIALFPLEAGATTLAGIQVHILHDGVVRVAKTDDNGIAEIDAIAIDRLPQIAVRVDLPAQRAG